MKLNSVTKEIILLCQILLIVWQMTGLKNNWLVFSLIIMSNIDVTEEDIETCHRTGKADKFKSKKTIISFTNRKNCKKAVKNRRKLTYSDFTKYQFPGKTKAFITENLTFEIETLDFQERRLKCNDHVFSRYTRKGVVFIKKYKSSKPNKISNLKAFRDGFEEFCETSVDEDISVQSSTVWFNSSIICIILTQLFSKRSLL